MPVTMVSSDAVIGRTTSTSCISGAGLKKWIPHTDSGRDVAIANSTIGSVDVLVARIAPAPTIPSSSANSAFLIARSSTTDSMTRSQPASAESSDVAVIRPRMARRSSVSRRPLSTCRSRPSVSFAIAASAPCWVRDRRTTSRPDRAETSTRPAPMIPEPRMPTVAMPPIESASTGSCVSSIAPH